MASGGQSRYQPRRVPQLQYLPVPPTVTGVPSRKEYGSDQKKNQEILQEIKDLRSLAKMHSQLQAKYTNEAERAIEECAVMYYLQAVSANKKMVEEYNSKAVNRIMDLHNSTHENPGSDQKKNQEILQEIKDLRSLAKMHSQLQAKYTNEAERAIEECAVMYYLQAVSANKKMVEEYNSKAVNRIMDLHNSTHENPDMLDLHLLQVNEAAECLDTFLDTHIAAITEPETNKDLFVITGRGLHSASGIPKIKEKIKDRLRERYLIWSEVNAGFLKVQISTDSRLTMDL